ncbi:hypothetical protein [Gottfriedia luciferensis]|uniref:hypothetical protein n=1 Tax=Gottfriedia luciferensis TaxID=178774 RepID=UPI000B4331BC|nr:hypothetical protein [Gottfriedia luciferensis]
MSHFLLSRLGNWKIQIHCHPGIRTVGNEKEVLLLDEEHDKIAHFSIDSKGGFLIHQTPWNGYVKIKEGYQTIVVHVPFEEIVEE